MRRDLSVEPKLSITVLSYASGSIALAIEEIFYLILQIALQMIDG